MRTPHLTPRADRATLAVLMEDPLSKPRYLSPQMLAGARAYALADRSDPFAFARAQTHLRNGVASLDASYEAEEGVETRELPDGRPYQVAVYRNIKRP